MKKKRILIIGSYDGSLFEFRGDFIKHLIKHGFEVFAAAPSFTEKYVQKIKDIGATPVEFNLQRTGLNPIKDFKSIYELKFIIKHNKIDLVFPYTVKPVIYGSMAANMCKVPVISLITGLGYAFSGISFKTRILQRFNEILYKLSIRKNKLIVFQNKDDYQLFLDRKVISRHQKVDFVSGSGVNLDQFTFKEKNASDHVSFLLVARLIKEKGIVLYMEAAKILKAKYSKAEFHLIGATETSPSAISEDDINLLLNVVNIIPLTTRKEGRTIYPNEALIFPETVGLDNESIALCHQIRTIDKKRLSKHYGQVTNKNTQKEIIEAIKFQFGIA